jgi:hypothetical protein
MLAICAASGKSITSSSSRSRLADWPLIVILFGAADSTLPSLAAWVQQAAVAGTSCQNDSPVSAAVGIGNHRFDNRCKEESITTVTRSSKVCFRGKLENMCSI